MKNKFLAILIFGALSTLNASQSIKILAHQVKDPKVEVFVNDKFETKNLPTNKEALELPFTDGMSFAVTSDKLRSSMIYAEPNNLYVVTTRKPCRGTDINSKDFCYGVAPY